MPATARIFRQVAVRAAAATGASLEAELAGGAAASAAPAGTVEGAPATGRGAPILLSVVPV